jgi:hypothetical protein
MVPMKPEPGFPDKVLTALRKFRQTAEEDTATLDLVHSLISYLSRARDNPGLRFEA